MRVLRLLLVAIISLLAVALGMIATAVVSLVTASVLFVRRKLRLVVRSYPAARREARSERSNPDDIIDVTATEVRAD